MRQAERKFITSTHIPDLDNANVGTYMITFFIESLITGDTLVSPVFHRMMILKTITMSSIRNQVDRSINSARAQPKLETEQTAQRKEDSRR